MNTNTLRNSRARLIFEAQHATIAEILTAAIETGKTGLKDAPPVLALYARPGSRSLAAMNPDNEPDSWHWAEKAAR